MICYFLSTVYIDVSMDDNSGKSVAVNPNGANGTAQRDENRSPTSGSSSETTHDLPKGAEPTIRKHRRQSRAKRKRKWKPYTELSWDERQVQDDKETKRACAKRERLTAEGHPIAPYNTTQFLMDDHKLDSSMVEEKNSPRKNSSENLELSDDLKPGSDGTGVNSSVNEDDPTKPGDNLQSDSRDDIQQFILQDFSHTYADIHAEQLQSMSKQELINECLKLEKRVNYFSLISPVVLHRYVPMMLEVCCRLNIWKGGSEIVRESTAKTKLEPSCWTNSLNFRSCLIDLDLIYAKLIVADALFSLILEYTVDPSSAGDSSRRLRVPQER